MTTRSMLLALLVAVLGGCGPAPTASETSRAGASAAGDRREPAERDQALNRAIQAPQDKARAVEEHLQEDQRRKREAMEAQGG